MKIQNHVAMINRGKFVAVSFIYSAILTYIYLDEIVQHWSYMGFRGSFSFFGLALSFASVLVLSTACPLKNSTRAYIFITMMFFAFIPSIIFFSYANSSGFHAFVFYTALAIVFLFSYIEINLPYIGVSNQGIYMYTIVAIVMIALIAQAAFGGLENFNLDIEKVYDFRRESAIRMPPIFAYVYSNVSSTLIPTLVVMAIKLKRYDLLALSLIMTIFMFGMSHHKSVLFGPIFVAMLYLLFSIPILRSYIFWAFMAIPILSLMEIAYVRANSDGVDFAYATSLIIRRVLFVPGMADGAYIEFFSQNVKYYWSYSSILSWAIDSPYNMPPPFVIGFEYFADLDTSANTGIIGSGFANAGLLGVTLYAMITGLLISIFNYYGEKIDRAVVAAISLTTVFNIFTSTDLLTAFLTHGLLLLIVLLALYPREQSLVVK
ncbi:MAG: hypothetical protein ABL909_02780 [Sphingopyxis sp.]